MASSVPPTAPFFEDDSSNTDIPDPAPSEKGLNFQDTNVTAGPSSLGLLGGVVFAIFAIIVGVFAVSQGAPGFFLLFAIVAAFIGVISAAASEGQRRRAIEQKEAADLEAQERLRGEIAQAVKDSMKSNIKVRCKYCGSLNDETATKCDSCGATL